MVDWLVLTAALPTSPSGLRVRIWRALKATGCATLRDGVYLLPAHAGSAAEFRALLAAVREGGAQAHLLQLQAGDAAQEAAFIALFDRAAAHAEFLQSAKDARRAIVATASSEAALRSLLRRLGQRLHAIAATDFFPGPAAAASASALQALRQRLDQRMSPGEPAAAAGAVPQLRREDFRRQLWATRRRPGIDRLATAWLVRRFVDRSARFLWLAQASKCPKKAIGFDFDGAQFTHRGGGVTFEVVVQSFGLEGDAALQRLGELVHCIDVGGVPVDEAAGVEALVRGLQARHADDDALLAAALPVFDALHAAFAATP